MQLISIPVVFLTQTQPRNSTSNWTTQNPRYVVPICANESGVNCIVDDMELHRTNIHFKFKSRIIHLFVVSVMVCVTINGFSFMITQLLESLQNQTKSHRYSKVCGLFFLNRYTSNYLYKTTLDTKNKENDVKICKYVSLLFFSRMLRCIYKNNRL